MNRNVVLLHLREAAEQLHKTIHSLESETDYGKEELSLEMTHLYHHLNTAWNGRDQTDKQFQDCTAQDFDLFRQFPSEADTGLRQLSDS